MRITLSMSATLILLLLFFSPATGRTEEVMNSKQLEILFSDTTFNVTDLDTKNQGADKGVRVYSTPNGMLRVNRQEDNSSQNRAWTISEGWRFCFSRNLMRRKGGSTCGIIVSEGGGQYKMYRAYANKVKPDQVPKVNRKKPLLLFSDFVRGNQL